MKTRVLDMLAMGAKVFWHPQRQEWFKLNRNDIFSSADQKVWNWEPMTVEEFIFSYEFMTYKPTEGV